MAKKQKLPLTTTPADWKNPFDTLPTEGLPPGQESPGPTPVAKNVPRRGRVILRKETAHRGGKTVIIVHDFPTHIPLTQLEALSRQLKKSCGCGGTLKGREIEIQGDLAPRIRTLLEAEGFQVDGVR